MIDSRASVSYFQGIWTGRVRQYKRRWKPPCVCVLPGQSNTSMLSLLSRGASRDWRPPSVACRERVCNNTSLGDAPSDNITRPGDLYLPRRTRPYCFDVVDTKCSKTSKGTTGQTPSIIYRPNHPNPCERRELESRWDRTYRSHIHHMFLPIYIRNCLYPYHPFNKRSGV